MTKQISSYVAVDEIKAEYKPYNTMHAFEIGWTDYLNGRGFGPHHYRGIDEQAYDRGVEAAMRAFRVSEWCNHNVGSN